MNITSFYVHGVPNGQEIWGDEQDRDYLKSFYTTYKEQTQFVVEIIPAKNRSFYSYIKGKCVSDSANREGSYFGMTVSFNGVYCTDTESLYRLFEQIFDKLIVGTILTKQNNSFRYIHSYFDGTTLETIKKKFFQQLEAFSDDFVQIDNSYMHSQNKQVPCYNITDVDCSSFFEDLKRNLKVYVSDEYLTKDTLISFWKKQVEPEKEKNRQLTDSNAELQNKVKVLSENQKKQDMEIGQLQKDKKFFENERNRLRDENQRIQTEFNKNKIRASVEKSVGQIKQPLDELLRSINRLSPPEEESAEPKIFSKKTLRYLNTLLLFIIFILLIICTKHLSQMDTTSAKKAKTEVKKNVDNNFNEKDTNTCWQKWKNYVKKD